MKTMITICSTLIALGLAFGAAAAEQILKPIHAYRLGNEDQHTVLYYVENGGGFEVVTTWVGEEEVLMRHIALLEPGQRYSLSLIERGLPVQFAIHSYTGSLVMVDELEAPAFAQRCSGPEAAYPTPLQRLVLCPRGEKIESDDHLAPQLTGRGRGSAVIGK